MDAITVVRLEFAQPDGRWTGPYCAQHLSPAASGIRGRVMSEHLNNPRRPRPDPRVFAAHPGRERHVCAVRTAAELADWFGRWFTPLVAHGGHVARYAVPVDAVALVDDAQVVYMQQRAVLLNRWGRHG